MLVYAPAPPLPAGPVKRRSERHPERVIEGRRTDRDGNPDHPEGQTRDGPGDDETRDEVAAPATTRNPISSETGAALLAILAGERD